MPVSFSLRQIKTVETGPLYRVKNSVDAATGSPPEVFVFKTLTQEFSHYATVADLTLYPASLAQAQADSVAFYRSAVLQRDWETVEDMEADIAMTRGRVQFLANELNELQTAIPSDTTTAITSV